ncbi:MAG: hypothetical protein QXO71_06170, partial [Candidatus Jordarchaeaceae archaeon]
LTITPPIDGILTFLMFLNPLFGINATLSLLPGFGIYFIWWYLITSYAFAGIFQRLFGVNFEI